MENQNSLSTPSSRPLPPPEKEPYSKKLKMSTTTSGANNRTTNSATMEKRPVRPKKFPRTLHQDTQPDVSTPLTHNPSYMESMFGSFLRQLDPVPNKVSMKACAKEAQELKSKPSNNRNRPEKNVGADKNSRAQVEEKTECNQDIMGNPESNNQEANSSNKSDPILDLLKSERVRRQYLRYSRKHIFAEIDLEHLAAAMKNRLNLVLPFIPKLRDCYGCGPESDITNTIIADISMMVDTAMAVAYNRLGHYLCWYACREPPPSPIGRNYHYKFPTFISSILSSIGPLLVMDSPEMLVLYSTSANRRRNYGRAAPFDFVYANYIRLVECLAAIGIPLAPIGGVTVFSGERHGSFFSTVILNHDNGLWEFNAPFHYSRYKPMDFLSAWFTNHDDPAIRVFEDCSLTVGCCTDPTVVNSVIAARTDNVPDDLDGATGPTRQVYCSFGVNDFGIRPAVAAKDGNAKVPAAVYIVGRGNKHYYCTSLARDLRQDEMIALLRECLFRPSLGSTDSSYSE